MQTFLLLCLNVILVFLTVLVAVIKTTQLIVVEEKAVMIMKKTKIAVLMMRILVMTKMNHDIKDLVNRRSYKGYH